MKKLKTFLQRKDIIFSGKRYGLDALGAMAQGLFCTLLVGTILNTLGQQLNIGFLTTPIAGDYTVGGLSSGMGTCGFVGQIGVYTGWLNDIAIGTKDAITAMDWIGLVLICFILPAILSWCFCTFLRKIGWIKENDLKLDL